MTGGSSSSQMPQLSYNSRRYAAARLYWSYFLCCSSGLRFSCRASWFMRSRMVVSSTRVTHRHQATGSSRINPFIFITVLPYPFRKLAWFSTGCFFATWPLLSTMSPDFAFAVKGDRGDWSLLLSYTWVGEWSLRSALSPGKAAWLSNMCSLTALPPSFDVSGLCLRRQGRSCWSVFAATIHLGRRVGHCSTIGRVEFLQFVQRSRSRLHYWKGWVFAIFPGGLAAPTHSYLEFAHVLYVFGHL